MMIVISIYCNRFDPPKQEAVVRRKITSSGQT